MANSTKWSNTLQTIRRQLPKGLNSVSLRSVMQYRNEAWSVTEKYLIRLKGNNARMVR